MLSRLVLGSSHQSRGAASNFKTPSGLIQICIDSFVCGDVSPLVVKVCMLTSFRPIHTLNIGAGWNRIKESFREDSIVEKAETQLVGISVF